MLMQSYEEFSGSCETSLDRSPPRLRMMRAHHAPISHCLFEFSLREEKPSTRHCFALGTRLSLFLTPSLRLCHMVVIHFLEIQAMFAFCCISAGQFSLGTLLH